MSASTRLSTTSMNSATRLLILLAGFTASALLAQPAGVRLPAPAKGAGAINALGDHLPAVAKAYGLTENGLRQLFETQPSLAVDMEGALHYVCEGLAVCDHDHGQPAGLPARNKDDAGAQDAMTPTSSVTSIVSGTAVDAFKLHSFPGVSKVIYLDFTGHTTSGTAWNTSYAAGADIVSAPFDLDGDPTTFNDTERGIIQRIWQRVAEDYAPFAVDVTTEDPGVEALRKTASNDGAYGVRVVISPTNWYKTTAGGVAYIGSFSANSDTPCYAFAQQLQNNEKYMAEAIAHEVGHTFGLYHDGQTGVTEYYYGQGNWAPIMGVGYYKSVVQFSRGEYSNASNTQDDLAIIASHAPLAVDDHGNSLSTATVIAGTSVATGGTIESRTDVDLFRFNSGAGTISLTVSGPAPDMDLDVKAELLNASGQVIQTSDSTSCLTAAISAAVAEGTYYLRISGVGCLDPVTTGYSSYGSIGNYIVMGTLVPSTLPVQQAPVAAITTNAVSGTAPFTVNFSAQNSTDADGSITSCQWSFGNGAKASGLTASYTYTEAGTYAATLTVVDNDGLSSTASVTITVAAPVVPSSMILTRTDVYSFAVSRVVNAKTGAVTGSAAITVLDEAGKPVVGATVSLAWAGVVSGTASGKTDAAGKVAINTGRVKKTGTLTGTVTGVVPATGQTYDAALYPVATTQSTTL